MSDYDKTPAAEASGPFPNVEEPMRIGRFNPKSKQKTSRLVGSVPGLVTSLVKSEIEQVKLEMKSKAIKGGTGAGLFAVVALMGITLWAVLITAAILGLNTVFAPWLSALIVAGALLVIMVIAAVVAIAMFKKMNGVVPSETLDSVRQDLNALKGLGKYE
ncbi:phage holin family protein [uncultured Gulosibacter sp.]|uniref:phage holin family protein n=1 Tax=uncultured Gulosibacter sp. TaxID=1339167 RepID=UPI00288A896D|nr:phage holin family protein [uncultured Gulosibacter sp.]